MTKLVEVTTAFPSLVRESDVYPKQFRVGDIVDGYPAEVALRNGWGKIAGDATGGGSDGAGGDDGGANDNGDGDGDGVDNGPAPTIKARLKRAVETEDDDGTPIKIAKGVVVEGDIARRLIAAGDATPVADNKSRGAAPETR